MSAITTPLPSGKLYTADGGAYAGKTEEELRALIQRVSDALKGPLPPGERALLVADRADMRAAIAKATERTP